MTLKSLATSAVAFCGALLLSVVGAEVALAQSAEEPGPKSYRSFFDKDMLNRGLVDMDLVNDRSARNSARFLIIGICKGSKPLKNAQVDNTDRFDNFFRRYYFPMMTHPERLGEIAEMRQDLMKQYFGGIKNDANGQEVRDRLNALTLSFMRGLVGTRAGEFHPAVRFNAMLIIGDLDSRGPELFGDPRPAEPLIAALDVMREELLSEDQIDPVRVAALIGIARHAELDRHRPADRRIPNAAIRPLIEPLTALATSRTPPPGRSEACHMWMRRQAVEVLASFAATRSIGPVANAVDGIISNPEEPLALRCAAAEAQGKMANPLAEEVTAEEAAVKLVRLAGDVLADELSNLDLFLDELEEDAGSEGGFPGSGGNIADSGLGILESGATASEGEEEVVLEKAPEIVTTQRRGKHRLQCVARGLFGVDGGPGIAAGVRAAEAKAKVDQAQALLSRTDEILTDEAPVGEYPIFVEVDAFYGQLNSQKEALAEIAPKPEPAAEPPAELGPAPGPGTGAGSETGEETADAGDEDGASPALPPLP